MTYIEQRLLTPLDALVLVRVRVEKARHCTRRTTKDAMKVWPNLVGTTLKEILSDPTNKEDESEGLTASTVWHCAHRVLKSLAPALASPSGIPILNKEKSCIGLEWGVEVREERREEKWKNSDANKRRGFCPFVKQMSEFDKLSGHIRRPFRGPQSRKLA